jgi:hypothetical protein
MREVSVGHNLVADTKTICYTVPTGYYAKWNLCYIVNNTGNNKAASAWWYDKSTNEEYAIVSGYILSPTQFLKFDGGAFVVLEEGDQVRLKSELGSTMAAINTFELIRKA